jgi:hypothetical protein
MLSLSKHQPNVVQKRLPLIRELCYTTNFDQKWLKKYMPLAGGFATHQSPAKSVPLVGGLHHPADFIQMCPKIAPLVRGLYYTADFDQMWPKNMPLIGGLYHTADINQMWPTNVPLIGGMVHPWTKNP